MKEVKDIKNMRNINKIFTEDEIDILRNMGVKIFVEKTGVSKTYFHQIREGSRDVNTEKAQRVIMVLLMFLEVYLKNINEIKTW